MGKETGITWTTSSWNPWIGCTEVSPGCDNCYARTLDKRHRWGGGVHWGAGVPRYRTSASNWRAPLSWNQKAEMNEIPWRVFPSLCDPFDNEVPEDWRNDLWDLICVTPNLTWLLLTKRIGNAVKMLPTEHFAPNADGSIFGNLWLGASVVNQEEADRDIPKLLATPAAKRFVSYEPALGPINFRPWLDPLPPIGGIEDDIGGKGIDWIIIGGESKQGGAQARAFDIAWARSAQDQCAWAGVPVFIKQLGSNPTCGLWSESFKLNDRAGADPEEWPEDLRVQEFPQ